MSIFSQFWGIVDPGGDPEAVHQAATACGALAEALRNVASSLDEESAKLAASWRGMPGPDGEDDSGAAEYQEAWSKFSAAVVDYANGLDAKDNGAKLELHNVANELQNAQDQARHLVEIAEASLLVGAGLSFVTFFMSDAFAEAGAVAMLTADAETIGETLGLVLRATIIAVQGLGQAMLNIATRFVIGATFAVGSEAFAKAVHGENPFNLDNWDANDLSSIIVLGMVSAGVGALASDSTGFATIAKFIKDNPVRGNIAYFSANGFLGSALSEYAVDGDKFNFNSVMGVVESTALSAAGGAVFGKYVVGGRIGRALGIGQGSDATAMPEEPATATPEAPVPEVSVAEAAGDNASGGEPVLTAENSVPPANPASGTAGPAAEGTEGGGQGADSGAGGGPRPAAQEEPVADGGGHGTDSGADGSAGSAPHAASDGSAAEGGVHATDSVADGDTGPAAQGKPVAQGGAEGTDDGADGAAGPAAHAAPDGPATDGADGSAPAEKSPIAKILTKGGEVTGVRKANVLRSTVRSPASSIAHALSFQAPPAVPFIPSAPPAMPTSVPNAPKPTPQPPARPHPKVPPTAPPGQPHSPLPPHSPAPPVHVGGGTVTVQPGDTLWAIAGERLGNPELYPLIEAANPKVGPDGLIFPGEVLNLPLVPAPPPGSRVVVVQQGDTLWGIAGGNEPLILQIAEINDIADPNLILVGQRLIVPPG